MGTGLMLPPTLGGWTRSALIELADRRTERRGSKVLDLDSEFLMALQMFCTETRWSWRRKTSIFAMQAGVWQYDLTAMFPTLAPNAFSMQPTWQIATAVRAGGFVYLLFPPGMALPTLTVGQTVYLSSETNYTFNGPVVITQVGSSNLLSNPGFESGLTGWLSSGMALARVPVHSGANSLEITGAIQVTVGQPGFALGSGPVTLTAWIYLASYAGASPVDVTCFTFDATGNPVAAHTIGANTATIGSWQSVTLTFTPASNEINAEVFCQINSQFSSTAQGPVTAFFDDISLVQGSTDLVTNGGFEFGLDPWQRGGVSLVSAPVHSGTSALMLSSSEVNCEVVTAGTGFPLTAGVPVQFTGWVYVAAYAGTKGVGIRFITLNALGGVLNDRFAAADVTKLNQWQQLDLTFTPLPSEVAGYLTCSINVESGTAGQVTAIFDDLTLATAVVGTQDAYNTSMQGGPNDVMALNPFTYIMPPNARDLHQFVKHGVKYFPNGGTPPQWAEITPMFERENQTSAIYTNLNAPVPGSPSQYFFMPGAFLLLCLSPVPDQNYPIMIDYWACPNLPPDSTGEQIPLVPAFLHHVLLKRLEAQIFRYTIGEGATKYQAAMAEYNMLVARYQGMDGMVPGEQIDYSDDDDYETRFLNAQNAVQSTV